MPFMKTGVAPISTVRCGCGQVLDGVVATCPKCKKTIIPANLQSEEKKEDKPKV